MWASAGRGRRRPAVGGGGGEPAGLDGGPLGGVGPVGGEEDQGQLDVSPGVVGVGGHGALRPRSAWPSSPARRWTLATAVSRSATSGCWVSPRCSSVRASVWRPMSVRSSAPFEVVRDGRHPPAHRRRAPTLRSSSAAARRTPRCRWRTARMAGPTRTRPPSRVAPRGGPPRGRSSRSDGRCRCGSSRSWPARPPWRRGGPGRPPSSPPWPGRWRPRSTSPTGRSRSDAARTARRAGSSGGRTRSWRSKRPGRRSAGSMSHGWFVAPSTKTP